jgi:antitoxin (DNA-binding transcriptional repressor) of toxin-antitoxin stability system
MKTATVRDLRNNFSRVSRWLAAGEQVAITKRGVSVGTILPALRAVNGKHSDKSGKPTRAMFRKRFGPEHAAWMKKVYGDKVLPGNSIVQMREDDRW